MEVHQAAPQAAPPAAPLAALRVVHQEDRPVHQAHPVLPAPQAAHPAAAAAHPAVPPAGHQADRDPLPAHREVEAEEDRVGRLPGARIPVGRPGQWSESTVR